MPPSAARSRIANAVLSSDCSPNVIVPRHSLETCRPLRPSLAWSIPARYLPGGAFLTGGSSAGRGGGSGPADPLVLYCQPFALVHKRSCNPVRYTLVVDLVS